MWFGTKFGLNRFDGLKFTTYTKQRNGLDFDDVQAIAQNVEGYLWRFYPNHAITNLNEANRNYVRGWLGNLLLPGCRGY
ncbi:hypothetical protein GCM10027592_43230 [Spirosoma flavus]